MLDPEMSLIPKFSRDHTLILLWTLLKRFSFPSLFCKVNVAMIPIPNLDSPILKVNAPLVNSIISRCVHTDKGLFFEPCKDFCMHYFLSFLLLALKLISLINLG